MDFISLIVIVILAYLTIRQLKKNNGYRAEHGMVTYQQYVTIIAIRLLKTIIVWCTERSLQLEKYQHNVDLHREEVVIPFLHGWMNEELDEETLPLLEANACRAVNHVMTEVGLRPRSSVSEEAIGRQLRRQLKALEMEERDIPYWSEICIQMYFNPPASVKAATGRIEGFH